MKKYTSIMIASLVLSFVLGSCGKDDETSCNDTYVRIARTTQDLSSTDCTVVVATYDKLIDLYEEGKDCKVITDAVKDNGYASVDEFLSDFRELRDLEAADCN